MRCNYFVTFQIGIIVVDELHLLGESGGRGATLEALLTKALYVNGKEISRNSLLMYTHFYSIHHCAAIFRKYSYCWNERNDR